MEVEAISAEGVHTAVTAVEEAHKAVTREIGDSREAVDDPEHWQGILETNAAEVLKALSEVSLREGYAVRYSFFERTETELRVRPFAARASTDVTAVRSALDWQPAPDSGPTQRPRGDRSVDLLYQHFSFTPDAGGVFQYWLAMQEIWASATWVHTRVVADRDHFNEIIASGEWQLEREIESYQPLVVRRDDTAHLALLLYSPLQRHSIALQQVEIRSDNSILYGESITVATGPRGYVA